MEFHSSAGVMVRLVPRCSVTRSFAISPTSLLQPIERMMDKVRMVSENPLAAAQHAAAAGRQEDKASGSGKQLETRILEHSIANGWRGQTWQARGCLFQHHHHRKWCHCCWQ